jgi:Mg/Co/Ni transporter MgtE
MNDDLELCYAFINNHPVDAVQIIEQISFEEAADFLNAAPPDVASVVFKAMNPFTASNVLEIMHIEKAATICQVLPTGIASALLRRVNAQKQQILLENLPADLAGSMQRVLGFAQGTAGALMKTRIMVLPDDITAAQGLNRLRQHPEQIFDYIYTVDRDQVLTGYVNVRHILLANPAEKVSAVMQKIVGRLSPNMKHKAILTHPGWRNAHALPVVDENDVFLGAVSYRTLRMLEEESEEMLPAVRAGDAGKALGELYWIGISAFIRGATAVVETEKKGN